MIDQSNIPPVADNELLARFIVYKDEKRTDGSVKHKLSCLISWLNYRSIVTVKRLPKKHGKPVTTSLLSERDLFTDLPISARATADSTNWMLSPIQLFQRIRTTRTLLVTPKRKRIKWQSLRCSPQISKGSGKNRLHKPLNHDLNESFQKRDARWQSESTEFSNDISERHSREGHLISTSVPESRSISV